VFDRAVKEGGAMLLSAERRNELDRAKNGKAIRVVLYKLGVLIGAIYFSTILDLQFQPWTLRAATMGMAVGLWVYMITALIRDYRSLTFLEKRLDEDLDKREPL
jgi:ATP/ADP translocase